MGSREVDGNNPGESYALQQQNLLRFAEELIIFATGPTVDTRRIVEEEIPLLPHRIATLWKTQPVMERVTGDLMGKHEDILRLLGGVGRYALDVDPTKMIPQEGGEIWEVADGLLGGPYRGGGIQQFILDAESERSTLISVRGEAGLSLGLTDLNMLLASYNSSRDNSHIDRANYVLNTFSISEGGERAQRFRRANAFLSTTRRAIVQSPTVPILMR